MTSGWAAMRPVLVGRDVSGAWLTEDGRLRQQNQGVFQEASDSEVQFVHYLTDALRSLVGRISISRSKLHPSTWPEVVERRKSRILRQLAREYGVSHEGVRRACLAMRR